MYQYYKRKETHTIWIKHPLLWYERNFALHQTHCHKKITKTQALNFSTFACPILQSQQGQCLPTQNLQTKRLANANLLQLCDLMVDHNVVSYNAMIEGYWRQDKMSERLDLFNEMRFRLLHRSLLTIVNLLGVSADLFTLELSKQIHALVTKYGYCLDVIAGNALIDVYSKCVGCVYRCTRVKY